MNTPSSVCLFLPIFLIIHPLSVAAGAFTFSFVKTNLRVILVSNIEIVSNFRFSQLHSARITLLFVRVILSFALLNTDLIDRLSISISRMHCRESPFLRLTFLRIFSPMATTQPIVRQVRDARKKNAS